VIDGRDFGDGDRGTSPRAAIVSRAFANRFWPGERAVGKRFWMGRVAADAPLTEVVGVVEDVLQYGLGEAPQPIVYRPFTQVPRNSLSVVARHDGRAPAEVIEALRQAAWSLDAALPLDVHGTMTGAIRDSIGEPRFRAVAVAIFSAIAALLACVGLYGTLAWIVRARRRELGIRMVLGADAGSLRRLVIRRGMTLALAGIAIGSAGAVAASRLLQSLVFGITTTDPVTFASAITAMAIVMLLACYLPARRAGKTDPVTTLRID
jgi:putative ABC transport system permease protein